MIPVLSSQNDSPETVVNQVKGILGATVASTTDDRFFQPTPESTPLFLDLGLCETSILDNYFPKDMEQNCHVITQVEESRYHGVEHDTLPPNTLKESFDSSLLLDHVIWSENPVEIQAEHRSPISVLDALTARIANENVEEPSFLGPKAHRIDGFFRETKITDLRQQTTLDKIKSVLSLEHQICLPSLLRQAECDGVSHGIDLYSLPMERLIKRAFQEPFGLAMFNREEDVLRVQERFVKWDRPAINISDLSVLVVSFTWGALLDPREGDLSMLVALVDTIPVLSKCLLQQNNTVQKFLALVAIVRSISLESE
ncbi:hypothetical protein yc1106_01345 [Curvularia clavata]|uniref:Uncharacterized protein n=1 Tax=Curvularia clavata TaxID=95742 RepID=A0A9Q8Z195_CURCL|nr:hypothetical protein yc1106_01345 [Curvularia clavata]